MNGNGLFLSCWLYIWKVFIKNTVLYKALHGIYTFISEQWHTSALVNIFRKNFFSEDAAKNSILGKLCFFPFLFLEKLQKAYAEKINTQKEKSIIIRFFKYLLHNVIALNLRFYGAFIFSGALVDLVVSVFRDGPIALSLIAMLVGFALFFADFNVTALFKKTRFAEILEKVFDTELSFSFFYITKCEGPERLKCAVFFGILSGLICGLHSSLWAFLFIAGLVFVCLVLYKVEFGVSITLFLAPFLPITATAALCFLCLISLLVKVLTTKKFTLRFEGMGLMLLMMLFLYFLCSCISYAPLKSLRIWVHYLGFMLFYIVIINTVRTKKQLFDLLKIFVLSGISLCVLGALRYFSMWTPEVFKLDRELFIDLVQSTASLLGTTDDHGELLLLVIPVSIAVTFASKKRLPRIMYGCFSLVLIITLLLTFSQGCFLGITVSMSVFVTFVCGKLWGLALIVLPLLLLFVPESTIDRIPSIDSSSGLLSSYRVSVWMGTILMLKDFWLAGIGLGTEAFTRVYPFYSYNSAVAQHPYNLFLLITTETGILGLLAFILLLCVFFKRLIVSCQRFKSGHPLTVMLIGIGSAILGFLIQGLFDNCFCNYKIFMLFWAVIATGSACCHITGLTPKE
ncbi:MAG: O-antigen ligase family protein [Clostridia bacterium]|nr:O-antigen ligase family protein [Clostridia bacterium]